MAAWRAFEQEVAALFENAGFQVTSNAKAASPRQTDIFAHDEKLDLLIEVKTQKRPINIDDIDALRMRLNRTNASVVGVIFSKSRLTRGARKAIETDRTRAILTFVEQEIDQLRDGRKNIWSLIEQKRESLTVHGKIWQSAARASQYLNVTLPTGDVSFCIGRSAAPYFESRSRMSGASYALEIHDTGWGAHGGEGVRLAIRIELNGISDLRDLMGYLHKTFGLSRNGMFFIHQSESCWHGVGAEEFLRAANDWRERYSKSPAKRFHHSEELGYYDRLYTGWVHLSAQQRVGDDTGERGAFLHNAEIVIQLPGVPADMSRFLRLCQYVNNDWAHFNYVASRWTMSRRLKTTQRLKPIGQVLKADYGPTDKPNLDSRVVVAIIARNPFYKKSSLPKELLVPELLPLRQITENELILCDLRDWHDENSTPDYYYLEGVEVTECGTGPILRPFGTWHKMR